LDAAQVKRLLKIAGTTMPFQGDMTVITLSFWLGLRAKELASLKVGDVYGSEGGVKQVLHLKAGYTKRSRTRDVYLSSDEIRKRLKEYWLFCLNPPSLPPAVGSSRAGSNAGRICLPCQRGRCDTADMKGLPLFRTRSGKAFTPNGMVHLLRHLHGLAGIDGGSSHSGRRTMITRLAETGVDLKSIATLAGHSSIRATAGYVENNP